MTYNSPATQVIFISLDEFRSRRASNTATKDIASEDNAKLDWYELVARRLETLSALPQGWDGYGAPPISTHMAIFAQQILCEMWRPGLPVPDITPMSDGSLMLEWFGQGRDLTIEIAEPYKLSYEMVGLRGSHDGEIGREIEPLRKLADELVEDDLSRALG